MTNKNEYINHIGKQTALLSIIEVGLGSLLHSFKIPFSGHFLSLNQGFILARATLNAEKIQNTKIQSTRYTGGYISNCAALLKGLSPAGKKLTPMLAISAQGNLFSLGLILLGVNPLGILLGMVLLGLWSFIQPLLIYYLIFGENLIAVGNYFLEKFNEVFHVKNEDLLLILIIIISIKIFLSLVVGVLSIVISDHQFDRYQNFLIQSKSLKKSQTENEFTQKNFRQALFLALKDLFHPLFIFSLLISIFFFYFSHSPLSQVIWGVMRPMAVGFIIFYLLRIIPFAQMVVFFEKRNFKNFASMLKSALEYFTKFK